MASYTNKSTGWLVRFMYTDARGNKKRKTLSPFRVKSEAQSAMLAFLQDAENGILVADDATTLVDYFDNWIKLYKKDKVSKVTMQSYETASRKLKTFFGNQKISEITRDQYQKYLNGLAKAGLAKATIKKNNSYVRTVERLALSDGLIRRSFTDNTVVSGAESKDEDTKYLDFGDFKKIIKLANERANLKAISYYIILTQAYTGLRFEEALGLTWDNVDFDKMEFNIIQSWMYKQKDGGFGPLKNKSSKRVVTFNSDLKNILKRLKKEQQARFLKIGYRDQNNLVFRNYYLEIVGNGGVNIALKSLCKACNVKKVTTHALRHTHGSVLIYEGVELLGVSKRLGHRDLQTTLSVYTHLIAEMQQSVTTKTTEILDKFAL